MKKSENFEVNELGTSYSIPKYQVQDGKGIICLVDRELDKQRGTNPSADSFVDVVFVRGDKTDNGITIPRVDGILHEQLLGMMIEDMKYKNNLVPSRESALAITKLQEALFWLEERQNQRTKVGTVGTYNK